MSSTNPKDGDGQPQSYLVLIVRFIIVTPVAAVLAAMARSIGGDPRPAPPAPPGVSVEEAAVVDVSSPTGIEPLDDIEGVIGGPGIDVVPLIAENEVSVDKPAFEVVDAKSAWLGRRAAIVGWFVVVVALAAGSVIAILTGNNAALMECLGTLVTLLGGSWAMKRFFR